MGGIGSGRKAKAKHERCKRCTYDATVLCPILDKIRDTDCVDCMWIPSEDRDALIEYMDSKKKPLPVCPYNSGIECEWAEPKDRFMGRPVRGHCICCSWCPEEAQQENSCHFGEWVKSKLGIKEGKQLWPLKN